MRTKEEIVQNWLPRYTATPLKEFGKHILLVNFQVVSSHWFDGLPEDHQAALVEECRRAGQETSAVIDEAVAHAKATLQERGMTIVEDVELDAFREAGEKAYEALNLVEHKSKVQEEIGK